MNEDVGFSERERLAADKRRKLDRTDLEYERMGLENTGRIKRFLSDEFRDSHNPRKKADRAFEYISRLQRLLLNTSYAKLYHELLISSIAKHSKLTLLFKRLRLI